MWVDIFDSEENGTEQILVAHTHGHEYWGNVCYCRTVYPLDIRINCFTFCSRFNLIAWLTHTYWLLMRLFFWFFACLKDGRFVVTSRSLYLCTLFFQNTTIEREEEEEINHSVTIELLCEMLTHSLSIYIAQHENSYMVEKILDNLLFQFI